MANNQTLLYAPKDSREVVLDINRKLENPFIRFNYFLDSYHSKGKLNFVKADIKAGDIANFVDYIKERKKNLAFSLSKKYDIRAIQAQVSWRLIVGLGQEHIQETSMCLDYVYGTPYIPASAIKGVLRHYYIENELGSCFPKERLKVLENILDRFEEKDLKLNTKKLLSKYKIVEKDNKKDKVEIIPLESTLNSLKENPEPIKKGQKIFGTQNKKGEVIFLDAVIESINRGGLVNDVMTPHYSKYYGKGQPPLDYLDPVPIPFLTIELAKFNFYFFGKSKEILDELWDGSEGLLAKALEEKGLGAKTSVGYGYFKNTRDITSEIVPDESKEQDQKQEIDLENMTETEKICYYLEEYKNAENPQGYENYSHEVFFKLDQFEEDDKIVIAKGLKAYWQQLESKWEGKLSKKQMSKVNKIKSILKGK